MESPATAPPPILVLGDKSMPRIPLDKLLVVFLALSIASSAQPYLCKVPDFGQLYDDSAWVFFAVEEQSAGGIRSSGPGNPDVQKSLKSVVWVRPDQILKGNPPDRLQLDFPAQRGECDPVAAYRYLIFSLGQSQTIPSNEVYTANLTAIARLCVHLQTVYSESVDWAKDCVVTYKARGV